MLHAMKDGRPCRLADACSARDAAADSCAAAQAQLQTLQKAAGNAAEAEATTGQKEKQIVELTEIIQGCRANEQELRVALSKAEEDSRAQQGELMELRLYSSPQSCTSILRLDWHAPDAGERFDAGFDCCRSSVKQLQQTVDTQNALLAGAGQDAKTASQTARGELQQARSQLASVTANQEQQCIAMDRERIDLNEKVQSIQIQLETLQNDLAHTQNDLWERDQTIHRLQYAAVPIVDTHHQAMFTSGTISVWCREQLDRGNQQQQQNINQQGVMMPPIPTHATPVEVEAMEYWAQKCDQGTNTDSHMVVDMDDIPEVDDELQRTCPIDSLACHDDAASEQRVHIGPGKDHIAPAADAGYGTTIAGEVRSFPCGCRPPRLIILTHRRRT